MPSIVPQQPESGDSNDPLMSLAEARQVRWPFDSCEPMGIMLDRRTRTRSKLEWAAKKAVWSDVCRVAQRLLQELDQPPAPATSPAPAPPTDEQPRHGARVVIANEYLEDQETLHGWLLAYSIGLGVGGVIVTIFTIFQWCGPWVPPMPPGGPTL